MLKMKKIFFFKYLLLYSTLAINHQGPTTKKTAIQPSPDSPNSPVFAWTGPSSIHITFPNLEEDTIHLYPSNMGGIFVKCLFDGELAKEESASAVISGCVGDSSVYITIYSSRLQGRVFSVRDNVTTQEVNPYADGGDEVNMFDFYEDPPKRAKRGTFEYYSGEEIEEYVDLPFDGPIPPIPSDIVLKYKLGYDESLKAYLGGEDAARDYTISVAAHATLHMKHSSLISKVHMKLVDAPTFAARKSLDISRRSLIQVQSIKKKETISLMMFCKTDDLSSTRMGVSWPGFRGGACNATKGAALVKWRGNPALAAITFSHESGHLLGMLHDYDEDYRNGFGKKGPCEGTGIMSDGSKDRPEQWSECSSKRLQKWYSNLGQCVQALECDDGSGWSTPCTCGNKVCLSKHTYCWKRNLNKTQFQCLSRMDIGEVLQTIDTSCGTYESCPSGWTALETGCHRFVNANTFNQAETNCKKEGGFLAEIKSKNEQNAFRQFAVDSGYSSKNVWLGATRVGNEWKWGHSNQIMTFSAWHPGNPDNSGGNENCLAAWGSDGSATLWNDQPCDRQDLSDIALCQQTGIRRWSGAQEKIWGGNQCQHLKNHHKLSLEDCKMRCLNTPYCTAINAIDKGDCVLRRCAYPIPVPQWKNGNYKGYFIQDAKGGIPPTPKCATACEHQKLVLRCPITEKMSIKFALYGRLEKSTCPMDPTSSAFSTTCSSSTAWSKVKELCEGKKTCSVDATNANFGDPCYGTQKYLSVCYVCSDVIKQ